METNDAVPIHPALLSGGCGTRLWPLSRKSFPRQCADLVDDMTLFQSFALMLSGPDYAPPSAMTASDFRFIAIEQIASAGIKPWAILIEPSACNTEPAILAMALHLARSTPGALMPVAPFDQVVPDAAAFRAAVAAGVPVARKGQVVTFGGRATRPGTGYGWLEQADDPGGFSQRPMQLAGFVEKPEAALAQEMLAADTLLWNAGIFLMSISTVIEPFQEHAPAYHAAVRAALVETRADLGFLRRVPGPWAGAENCSSDHVVMERASNLCSGPLVGVWSDRSDWASVLRDFVVDAKGLATMGPVTAIDCRDSLLWAPSQGTRMAGIGVTDMFLIAMPVAVLVADRHRVQEVKAGRDAALAERRAAGRDFSARSPAPGMFRDAGAFRLLSGQADRRASRRSTELARPFPPVRALDRGLWNSEGDHERHRQPDDRKPVGLCSPGGHALAGVSGKGADGPDRSTDRRLSGRGRLHAFRRCPFARRGGHGVIPPRDTRRRGPCCDPNANVA